jgi:hypothetical protein
LRKITLIVCTGFLAACATQNKSVGLGAALGGGTGALVGSIADPGKNGKYRTRNIILGTAIGGMAGAVAGSAIHDETERKKKEAFLKGQASAPLGSGSPPNLSSPKVETRWIEGRAVGNRYIEGHFEYIIIEPARWEATR